MKPIARARLYLDLIPHWWRMIAGRSYWHTRQGIGTQYRVGELAGYFNDLTGKTDWRGQTDLDGLPVFQTRTGVLVHFPTTLTQKALGHWDRWLSERRDSDRDDFMRIAFWLLENQDAKGGIEIWPQLGLQYASPYSAMVQGEAISVLTRAYRLSGAYRFLDSAHQACKLLLTPITEGGTSRYEAGLVLEEYPLTTPGTVMNGWIFALYGLYDFSIVTNDPAIGNELSRTLITLADRLETFDAGYWSYYDDRGSLASPFYHHLHIAQLQALEMTFLQHAEKFNYYAQRFADQSSSRYNRARAVAVKAYQKLLSPPDIVIK